jgi:membrane-associated phospholipid phosphatase
MVAPPAEPGSLAPGVPLLAPLTCSFCAFVALAALVAHGDLARVDTYAARHLMTAPSTEPGQTAPVVEQLLGYPQDLTPKAVIVFPASATVASLLALLLGALIWRRGDRGLAVAYLAAYGVGNGIEVLCKALIERPPIRVMTATGSFHVGSFDSSFPSGHALRAVLLAAGVVLLWRRLLPLAVACVLAIVLTLEIGGYHTPSDIVGGILLGGTLVLGLPILVAQAEAAVRNRRVHR